MNILVIFNLRRHTIPQINPLNILFSPFLITFGDRNGSFWDIKENKKLSVWFFLIRLYIRNTNMNSKIFFLSIVVVIVVADIKNDENGKSSISADCELVAIHFNEVSQSLYRYKRDLYILISLIVLFFFLFVCSVCLYKRRNPGWRVGNFSIWGADLTPHFQL